MRAALYAPWPNVPGGRGGGWWVSVLCLEVAFLFVVGGPRRGFVVWGRGFEQCRDARVHVPAGYRRDYAEVVDVVPE